MAALWTAYTEENADRAVVETMRHTWKALAPTFSAMMPDEIEVAHCRDHTASRRAKGISDGTIHTELGHLRMVLLWAVKRRLIERAPHIDRPAKPKPKDHYLTREEVQKILDAATMPHVRLYIVLLITSSARIGALLDLTWDRVDLDKGLIHLSNPDDSTRRKGRATVPINRSAMAALQEAKAVALSEYVIEWAGKPVKSIKKSMATTAARAGVHATPHIFRHSAAVWMAIAGIDDRKIADFLGHGDSSMVRKVYGKYRPDHLRDAAEVLELDVVQMNRRELRK